MDDIKKARVLQELIVHNGFATSASALAKELGYTGKSQIYRIQDGSAGDGTVEEVWKRIREKYDLTDEEIVHYIEAILLAKSLWQVVRDLVYSEEDLPALAEEMLCALLAVDEDKARKMLLREDWLMLTDIRREHPKKYAQMVVMFYIYMNNVERAYKGKAEEMQPLLLNGLCAYMVELKPENHMPQDLASAYCSDHPTGMQNLWENIQRPVMMVQAFVDPNFGAVMLNSLRFLPLDSPSLWMTHEGLRSKTATAYFMYESRIEGLTGGRYECVEVEACVSDTRFVLKRAFAFSMMKPDEEDEADLAFVFSRDEDGQIHSVKYAYYYDQKLQNLHLQLLDDEVPANVLPTELHYVDPDHLLLNEEREWRGWMLEYLKENEEKIFLEIMNASGMTLEDDYEIVDVAVSRLYLTITISNGEETAEYRADLESHPGLRQVSPAMKAFLLRHHDDDKLYLEWITPHVVVAIEEFERI